MAGTKIEVDGRSFTLHQSGISVEGASGWIRTKERPSREDAVFLSGLIDLGKEEMRKEVRDSARKFGLMIGDDRRW